MKNKGYLNLDLRDIMKVLAGNFIGVVLILSSITVFGQVDSVATEPGGLAKFYDQYAGIIWTVLGMSGIIAWLVARYNRLMKAFNTIRVAGDDASPQGKAITLGEWQGILTAFGNIFGKLTEEEKNDIVSDIKIK